MKTYWYLLFKDGDFPANHVKLVGLLKRCQVSQTQVRLVRRTRFRGAVKKVMAQLRKQNLIQVRVSRVCLFECMARLSGWHGICLTWEYQVECECECIFHAHFLLDFFLVVMIMSDHAQKYHYLVLLLAAIGYRILVVPKFVDMV